MADMMLANREHIVQKVKERVKECLKIEKDKVISDDAKFVEDLGADSLDMVELTMGLEESFGCEITDEEASKLKSVKDVVAYIETKTMPRE